MNYQIDDRGLTCPLPVLRTSKVLGEIDEGLVVVIVDSAVARDNISRLAKSMDCTVSVEKREDDYCLTIIKH